MSDINNIYKFVEYLAEAVIIADEESNIIFANSASSELLGYSKDELINNTLSILLNSKYRDGHKEYLKKYIVAGSEPKRMTSRKELHCIKANGEEFPARISISTIDIDGQYYGIALLQDQTLFQKQITLIESQAITDPLTLLYNRRYLDKVMQPDNRWLTSNPAVGVLYIDLDKFKDINDKYGHDTGDAVLKAVAVRLKETFRSDDLLFRLGGDEFLILLALGQGSNHVETITMLAKKLHENMRRPISHRDGTLYIDASIGAGIYPDDFDDIEIMTKLSDKAMYFSKKNKEEIFFVSDLPDKNVDD